MSKNVKESDKRSSSIPLTSSLNYVATFVQSLVRVRVTGLLTNKPTHRCENISIRPKSERVTKNTQSGHKQRIMWHCRPSEGNYELGENVKWCFFVAKWPLSLGAPTVFCFLFQVNCHLKGRHSKWNVSGWGFVINLSAVENKWFSRKLQDGA